MASSWMENGDLPAHAFGLFSLVRQFLAASRSIRMASRSLALSASWSHSAALVRNSSASFSYVKVHNTKERTPFKAKSSVGSDLDQIENCLKSNCVGLRTTWFVLPLVWNACRHSEHRPSSHF